MSHANTALCCNPNLSFTGASFTVLIKPKRSYSMQESLNSIHMHNCISYVRRLGSFSKSNFGFISDIVMSYIEQRYT
jgi:hypothetical protein